MEPNGYIKKILLSTLKPCVEKRTESKLKIEQIISSDYEDEQNESIFDQNLNSQKMNSFSTLQRRIHRKNLVFDKRDFLFPQTSKEIRKQIQLDDVALYSVTDMRTADEISDFISQLDGLNKSNIIITDATACAGGNTSSFSRKFKLVQAVEINDIRHKMLVHNLTLLGCNNVKYYHENYLNLISKLNQDVVFIDPPWGGPSYKDQDQVELFLGDIPLDQICQSLQRRTKYVIIKAPPNLNYDKFKTNITGNLQVLHQFRKMLLIIVDYCHPSNVILQKTIVNNNFNKINTKENQIETKDASQNQNICVISSAYTDVTKDAVDHIAACYRDYLENDDIYQKAYSAAYVAARHGQEAARTAAKSVYDYTLNDRKIVNEYYEEPDLADTYLQVAGDHDYYISDTTDDIDSGMGTQTGDIDNVEDDVIYNINVSAACNAHLDDDDF